MPQRLDTLVALDEAITRLVAAAVPVPPTRTPIVEACGGVLAHDIVATADVPAGAVAARDGFAVRADETLGASPYGPAPLTTAPAAIATGAPLPRGTDAVAPRDAVTLGPPVPEALAACAPGDGVTPAAHHLRAGATVFAAGHRLLGRDVAVALAAGAAAAEVRQARVGAVCAKRDAPGTVAMIAPSLPMVRRLAPAEDRAALLAVLRAVATMNMDAIVVVGGTGEADDDWAADAIAAAGTLIWHGVALDPGGTAAFGRVGQTPILALPRHPPAAFAAAFLLGTALRDRLTMAHPTRRGRIVGRLTRKIVSVPGATRLVFVRSGTSGLEPLGSADVPLPLLAAADGCVVVPPESEGMPAGAEVEVAPFSSYDLTS
jgi:molybdopterin biosynthesis enzyme